MSSLLSPTTIGPLSLKNKVCLSAVWMGRGDEKTGEPSPSLVSHYANISKGGCGLIIVEHTAVCEEGMADPKMLRMFKDEHIGHHKKIVDGIHATPGTKVILQLNNAGGNGMHPNRYVPSSVEVKNMGKGKEMTLEMIHNVPLEFAKAAQRAKAAGYDGIQIHAAHGYLISTFLSPITNRRTDMYGGSLENRSRLLVEAASAVRKEVGKDFAVAVKINSNDFAEGDGLQPEEVGQICKSLEGVVDFVELSGGTPFGKFSTIRGGMFHKDPAKEFWYCPEQETISKLTSMPTCVVGGIRTPEGAERALKAGASLVSLGRPFIRHTDIVKHWTEGTTFTPCISCNQCIRNGTMGKTVKCYVAYGPGETDPLEGE